MGAVIWYLIVFLVDAGLVVQLVARLIEREVDLLEVIIALLLLGALNGFMLLHGTDPLGPAIALLIIAFGALHRLLTRLLAERQLAAIRARDLSEYQRMIAERPDIPYPYQAIGDYFFEHQFWAEAIAYYKQFLARQNDPEVRWKLRKAEEELARQAAGLRQCPNCGNDIPADAKVCPVCGYYIRGLVLDGILSGTGRLEIYFLALLSLFLTGWAVARIVAIDTRVLIAVIPLILLPLIIAALALRQTKRDKSSEA